MGNKAKVSREQVREAVNQLRLQGREPTISAIREFVGGEGSNSTLQEYRDEHLAELAEQQAATRRLDPDDAALARELMERAVSRLMDRIESKSRKQIDEAATAAKAEIERAQRLADEALAEAGQRVRERDEARQQLHDEGIAHRETRDRAVRAEGQAEQQVTEIARLAQAIDSLRGEKEHAIALASELRAHLTIKTEREQELLAEIAKRADTSPSRRGAPSR